MQGVEAYKNTTAIEKKQQPNFIKRREPIWFYFKTVVSFEKVCLFWFLSLASEGNIQIHCKLKQTVNLPSCCSKTFWIAKC